MSECSWVKFQDSDYLDWVGIFGHGWGGGNFVCVNESGVGFVIANGQGYVVDVNLRELLLKTECDYLYSCVAAPDNMFVATDGFQLRVYDTTGESYCSDRVSIDGVEFDGFCDELVSGTVWDLSEGVKFTFNPFTKSYQCNWKCPID